MKCRKNCMSLNTKCRAYKNIIAGNIEWVVIYNGLELGRFKCIRINNILSYSIFNYHHLYLIKLKRCSIVK